MTKVLIMPEETGSDGAVLRASARDRESVGRTAGQALDALTSQLTEEESGTLVVIQAMKADEFFTAAQRTRMVYLIDKWREEREAGQRLNITDQKELDGLVRQEIDASARRADAFSSAIT